MNQAQKTDKLVDCQNYDYGESLTTKNFLKK